MRVQVAGLTATVASQLSEITAEMNRIRAALGSDADLGDIQAELDAVRSQLKVEAREGGAATARVAPSIRGDLRRRQQPVPARNDSFDGVDESVQIDQSRVGLIFSIVIVFLMLGGPLWPLTAQAIASFSSVVVQETPWYDQIVTEPPVPHIR